MYSKRDHINRQSTSEMGFSLIEVMMAMAIFSIGILAVIGLQFTAIAGNSGSRKISDVLILAEDQIESLIVLPYDDAQLDPDTNPHRVDTDGYSMIWNVVMTDLDGDGTDDAKQIQLTAAHLGDADRTTTVQYLIPEQ